MRIPLRSFLGWAVALAVIAGPSFVNAQQSAPLAGWGGVYRFVGGAEEVAGVQAAVSAATETLNSVLKHIARIRLSEVTEPYRRVRFEVLGKQVKAWLDDSGPWVTHQAEAQKVRSPSGDKVLVTHRAGKKELVQKIQTRRGVRTNTYTVSPDGKTLVLKVTIKSSHLPEPISYKLSYRRES